MADKMAGEQSSAGKDPKQIPVPDKPDKAKNSLASAYSDISDADVESRDRNKKSDKSSTRPDKEKEKSVPKKRSRSSSSSSYDSDYSRSPSRSRKSSRRRYYCVLILCCFICRFSLVEMLFL